MMIVTPMIAGGFTLPLDYGSVRHGEARHALMLAGVLPIVAALAVLQMSGGQRAAGEA